MPFLAAPLVLSSIIGGGASLGAAALSRRGRGGNSNDQISSLLAPLINDQRTNANRLFSEGLTDLSTTRSLLSSPTNFWQRILNTDSSSGYSAMSDALGPEMDMIDQQREGAYARANYGPRSSFASSLSRIETASMGEKNRLLATLRPQAAGGLSQIASIFASLFGSESGNSINAINSLISTITGREQSIANRNSANNQALGQGIGSLIGILIGPGGLLNQGGRDGGGSTSGGLGGILAGITGGGGG